MAHRRRRLHIGGTFGTGKRAGQTINPADLFQTTRRAHKQGLTSKPRFRGMAGGFWKGKQERSYIYDTRTGKKGIAQIRKGLEQEAIYSEDRQGFELHGEDWGSHTKYKYVIIVQKRRGMNVDALIHLVSDEKSKYHLFDGGTVFDQGTFVIVESALFDKSAGHIGKQAQDLVHDLRAVGVYARTKLVRVS